MGRWGYRLFEGDQDLDIAIEINQAFGTGDKDLKLSNMVHQTDMLAPPESTRFYKTDKYKTVLAELIVSIRQNLDSGLGDALFDKYRKKESEIYGRYRVILVGALMMRAGAKVRDNDFEHLRELVPKINCNEGYTWPLMDEGFRGPGKRQFLAALDHYKPGVPRSFAEPSCFNCGKIEADTGNAPERCGRCQRAWYCDKDCQKAHWKAHKPSCIAPENCPMLNV